ncbi:hypothetical protein [Streptomyces sp. NRRL F-5123]|uniref:hypothetical protein n=1 Tax=Streptomyces sp. NRRL F-5123 TaxID=1463856 RepID=UPI000AD1098A|nr:hypothetical protein [Streptomyces sp. NRRL F-5123]
MNSWGPETASVVPLAWTGAVTMLALVQLDGRLPPVPPARCTPPPRGECPR